MVAALQITMRRTVVLRPRRGRRSTLKRQPLTGFRQWTDALPADARRRPPCRIIPHGSSYAVVMDQPGSLFARSVSWEPACCGRRTASFTIPFSASSDGLRDVDATGVAVIARCDGVVTLTGFVDSYWQKYAVEAAAKRVRGVRAVANDVHIRLSRERTDPEIAHDAVLALKRWPSVPRTVIVTVRDGFLTLEGRVQWNDQRTDAESAVRHIDGVKGVSNAIVIGPVASVN